LKTIDRALLGVASGAGLMMGVNYTVEIFLKGNAPQFFIFAAILGYAIGILLFWVAWKGK